MQQQLLVYFYLTFIREGKFLGIAFKRLIKSTIEEDFM
jgi:hypothetical protein